MARLLHFTPVDRNIRSIEDRFRRSPWINTPEDRTNPIG